MNELEQKLNVIQALLDQYKLQALLLRRVSSFAWATDGAASYVNTASTEGTASLLFTPSGHHLITNNIEAPRLEQEERLKGQGWEFHISPWYAERDLISRLIRKSKLGADGPYAGAKDLSDDIARMRSRLTRNEVDRFRMLGRLCAAAMDSAARIVRPYMTEHEIAGILTQEAERRGVQSIVTLIATDGRIFAFRHPLPTTKRLEHYVMLVLCGRRAGMVCSVTRLVHFGPIPDDLRHKMDATSYVDAALIAGTRPGRSLGEVFQDGVAAYKQVGFPDEWHLHHQGGPAGYEPREYIATPDTTDLVSVGQVYAWNPSITGTKSEDTILVGELENEILTYMPEWPMQMIEIAGQQYLRPTILEVV
jgi:Xaa-Pro aminopeptidase